jgi:hypothetical protein
MTSQRDRIRAPRLWAVIGVVGTLVAIGLVVFLRRYRGADRTAMALGLLDGAGVWLVLVLTWFQLRFGGTVITRQRLRWIGFRCGALAGVGTGVVGVLLLAVRWAIDQLGGPVGERFMPAFLRAVATLGVETTTGLPAYVAVGIVAGSLIGLGVAEGLGVCAQRAEAASSPEIR